jgi:tetratricopeptide (TPR) repeat protein
MIEKSELLNKLLNLENEILFLKEEIEIVPKSKFTKTLNKVCKFFISYWVLLSFLVTILTALYIKFEYKIEYLEHYSNLSTTKKLSEFYRELGDRMMVYSEWVAAEAAYREAINLNPNNLKATYGIVKSQVFQPLEGQKFSSPEVVDSKLAYLKAHFPDDYDVYFLQGIRYKEMGDIDSAKLWFQKSIDKNPEFVGGYLELGYLQGGTLNIKEAIKNYHSVLKIDPNYARANNNLGFCYMLTTEFEKAIALLEKSYRISPLSISALNIGDSYLYLRNFDKAQLWFQHALEVFKDTTFTKERYASGECSANYLPLFKGDSTTIKYSIKIYDFKYIKAFIHYSLSFTYAFLEDFNTANQEFRSGRKLDTLGLYNQYIFYKIRSIQNFLTPNQKVTDWFEKIKKQLMP